MWPGHYGSGARIGAHLRYLWTSREGNLLGFLAESKTATFTENCSLSKGDLVYY